MQNTDIWICDPKLSIFRVPCVIQYTEQRNFICLIHTTGLWDLNWLVTDCRYVQFQAILSPWNLKVVKRMFQVCAYIVCMRVGTHLGFSHTHDVVPCVFFSTLTFNILCDVSKFYHTQITLQAEKFLIKRKYERLRFCVRFVRSQVARPIMALLNKSRERFNVWHSQSIAYIV